MEFVPDIAKEGQSGFWKNSGEPLPLVHALQEFRHSDHTPISAFQQNHLC